MRNIDKLLETMLEDMDTKQLWHLVFNKMTKRAKRQLLSEIINGYLGGLAPVEGFIFDKSLLEQDKQERQDISEEGLSDTQKLINLHEDLLKELKPFLSDFTGYDENHNCFNIVLAVKEILEDYKTLLKSVHTNSQNIEEKK